MWETLATDSCDACQYVSRSKRLDGSFMDKENVQQGLSPTKSDELSRELSFYGNASPTAPSCTGTSPSHCAHHHNILTSRRPLEDHDPNSRDSGYNTNYSSDGGKFSTFTPSRGCSSMSCETGSICSMEDEFLEDFSDLETLSNENNALPRDFNTLINGPIAFQTRNKEKPKVISPKDIIAIRPLFRRALSLQNDRTTPNSSKVRSCLFKPTTNVAAVEMRPFKRPEPPLESESPSKPKKAKIEDEAAVPMIARPILKRAFSATEESIMCAVQRSSAQPDLIGDFSKTFSLPLTQGRHQDLKSITPAILARLMRGAFSNVASFKVIDCRYPYEYDGGHIEGALNIYTKDQCMDLLNSCKEAAFEDVSTRRSNILVFHCEFSSERGPNLCRYLRQQDRQLNQDVYPSLNYPEVYLLEGGYKNFFEQYSNLCVPVAYKEMLHPGHENDLRYFRLKSKTWNVDTRQRAPNRINKKLGL